MVFKVLRRVIVFITVCSTFVNPHTHHVWCVYIFYS
uniref:Uncharacterized protein n=1 Tax=Arundo donax TaxID=35708 RepID=A0A0A9B3Q0_ARUDO